MRAVCPGSLIRIRVPGSMAAAAVANVDILHVPSLLRLAMISILLLAVIMRLVLLSPLTLISLSMLILVVLVSHSPYD